MGTPLEADLEDQDGAIVSVAQVDSDVWAAISAQANALATQAGFTIDTGPLYNKPERNLTAIGDVQSWLAAQSNVGAVRRPVTAPVAAPPPAATTTVAPPPSLPYALAGTAVGGLAGFLAAGPIGLLVGHVVGWLAGLKIAKSR